jgi:hypothetical protein
MTDSAMVNGRGITNEEESEREKGRERLKGIGENMIGNLREGEK